MAEIDELEAALEEAAAGDAEAAAEDLEEQPEAGEAPQAEENEAVDEDLKDMLELAEAADASPVVKEAGSEDESDGEDYGVEEHLKDAVEGSLRLKRLLSRDDDEVGKKKRRVTDASKEAKVKMLLVKWTIPHDRVIQHVLRSCNEAELDELIQTKYMLDVHNQWKTCAEILGKQVLDIRERPLPKGQALDNIASFSHSFKLDAAAQNVLRTLTHKDLRYVMQHFDGTTDLKDVIKEAKESKPFDDYTTSTSVPKAPGLTAMSRFMRLELIDPTADAAVFGDANLTFAIKLAQHRKALGHVGRVIATTFEEIDTLRERYKEIDESIQTLEEHFAEVYHGVDCTKIALNPKFKGLEGSLGAVYYNFPHSGAIGGFFDGHPVVNWRHENLMRLFFRALRSFVKPGGFVKVASNCGAVGVRYSYIIGSALENEFKHVETVPFLEWHLHRYGRSYGDKRDVYKRPDAKNNQSYNAQAADRDMVYCFRFAPSGESLPPQTVRLPPNLKTLQACIDGPFKNLSGSARLNLASQLHKRFVTEISGTHVG